MSPEDADQRIILSRHTLTIYEAMVDAGDFPVTDIDMMSEEIDLLERVAYRFHEKRGECESVAIEWRDLMVRIKPKLN